MKTTIFFCDKCSQSFSSDGIDRPIPVINGDAKNVLLEVKVEIASKVDREAQTISKQICRDCLKKLGLSFDTHHNIENSYPTQPSLEDKLIEILSELGVKFEE